MNNLYSKMNNHNPAKAEFCRFPNGGNIVMADQESMYDIGTTLLVLRTERNYTQDFVAAHLLVSQTTLSRYEKGGNDVPFSVIERAAELYRMSIETFIRYKK